MVFGPVAQDQPRAGRGLRIFSIVGAALAAVALILAPVGAQASPTNPLIVTFTFDDGAADQLTGQQLLEEHGMTGTFYINSGFIGLPGYMTRSDLDTLAANGHEIGGHTVTHQDLPTLDPDEANRQICQDRNTLLSWGFAVTSFAYPYAEFNPAVQAIVEHCGYNTARAVGDLLSPFSCFDCPASEPLPPTTPYATLTPDDVESTWTLANLQNLVQQAEVDGGWLPFNLHHVCAGTGCALESISPTVLDEFLDWLQPRSDASIQTTVSTVQQVIGGAVQPAVEPIAPPAPGAVGVNTVRNASLETAGTLNPEVPQCWSSAGYGDNTATQTRVTDAHSGTYASQITVTSHTDGDAKLVPTFDLGTCSSQLTAGKTYEVSTWYKSDVEVFFTLYQRNAIGQWSYWTQSPRLAPAAGWTQATWVTPVPPAEAVAASFGLTIDSVGTLVTDDYGFAEAPSVPTPAPPGINALKNPSLETAGTGGFPQCWTGAGYGTNTPQWTRVTDAADGTYAQQLEITALTDGDAKLIPGWDSNNCAPTVLTGHTYTVSLAYKATAPTFLTFYRQDDEGVWSWWTQSPPFAAAESWTTAGWQTPVVPTGTRAVTFGLTLDTVGTLTTDNYSFAAD